MLDFGLQSYAFFWTLSWFQKILNNMINFDNLAYSNKSKQRYLIGEITKIKFDKSSSGLCK